MCLWTHWAWEALSCCVNTAHPRWPGTFCVKTTQLAVRSGGSSSRCGWGGPGAGCPHVGTGWLSPAHGHDPRTYPETVACSLLGFVFQIKLQKRTKNSRNGVTNEVVYSIQRVEPHRNHLLSHVSCFHARVRGHAWENVACSVTRTVHGTRSLRLGPFHLCWLQVPRAAWGDHGLPAQDSGQDEPA